MNNSARNILIVDDNVALRKPLVAIIQAEGYRTCEASEGAEALELLEEEKVDAIISDILMPGMDGYRLCYEVRRSRKHSALPFIFLTGVYTSAEDEQHALDIGADGIIRKPISAKEVLKVLREMFSDPDYRKPRKTKPIGEVEVIKEYSDSLVTKLE
ncbi:MAG: response regulator, partial [bacterium]